MKKRISAMIVTLVMVLSLGTLSVCALNSQKKNGGTWRWGSEGSYAISNYYLTKSKSYNTNGVHSSTVIGKTTDESGWVNPGKWSKAKVPKVWYKVEHCYYNAKDYNGTPMA